PYDLLILDLGLPKMDGLEVLKTVRGSGHNMPVIILTARDGLDDRVLGLDLGANDYVTKPFQLPELEARIRALLRKDNWDNHTEVVYGQLSFNTLSRAVLVDGQPLDLSARELAILEILLQRSGRMVSKQQIVERLSTWDTELSSNAVDITMHRLRKKLEASKVEIKTLRGLGYLLEKID
ncbi:MAG TPA: response regulator transcription factor, partial [Candidatus Obscuribacter sp.]|nr:response regulator transcription factor [Candidatus Obscuribacter sp.]